ncbi:hypothetical protein ABL78_7188 [Leptomonas seymouri]|uniref:Uncharacterized protein n=1 Tax=Leptomonas seymouri TaxID=5684 RepID=A0A0N1I2D5_LEPSE|nr:hypothetical protein ABL78_7188 [Leptomonas seymouri]|eukprot:KPI83772.1 hypothetical protein ABL78_7188 [Leptomonas seymouri]
MKRRVLRAHANKRCLRILSASNQLRTPSSGDRGYAVLCDASFLRAVLLSYWQAHAPSGWRESRKRQLRRAAAPQQAMRRHQPSSQAPQEEEVQGSGKENFKSVSREGRASASEAARLHASTPTVAAIIARLPVQLPSPSPFEFLNALMTGAFQVNGSDGAGKDDQASTSASKQSHNTGKRSSSSGGVGKSAPFLCYCLPETVANLHRMRDAAFTAPSSTAPHAGEAASKAESVLARDGQRHPLTFQEVPAVVVDALLSRLSLLHDPQIEVSSEQRHNSSDNDTSGHAKTAGVKSEEDERVRAQQQQRQHQPRSEANAVADFMSFNQLCLARGCAPSSLSEQEDHGFAHVRLCSMLRFTDCAGSSGHHALKRLRQKRRIHREAEHTGAGPHQQDFPRSDANEESAAAAGLSKPFTPQFTFVATQSHDIRKRLAPATALLRLTTNPDALWIEQRGTAYRYEAGDDNGVDAHRKRSPASRGASSLSTPDRQPRSRHLTASTAPCATSSAPTVVSAAPPLSRADVAFMKHLGKATHLTLPERASSGHFAGASPQHAAVAAPGTVGDAKSGAEGGAHGAGRKRSRQKGQNPLSMKKKHKREVFRA